MSYAPQARSARLVRVLVCTIFVAAGLSAGPAAIAQTTGWQKGAAMPAAFVPRWDQSYAYFPPSDQVVLFGGSPKLGSEGWSNQTWLYQSGVWKSGPAAPSGLTPRGGAAMAFDAAINKIVMFGGVGSSWPPSNQTWLYDGSSWKQGPAAPSGMAGRAGAMMAYDPDLNKVVLFGGSGEEPYRDTWLFDGTRWQAGPSTPGSMAARTYFGMVYDASLRKIVLGGGSGDTDVWLFGGSWTKGTSFPSDMGPRERIRMAYEPDLNGTVVFGGLGPGSATQDLWLLSGGRWQQLNQGSSKPAARLDANVLYHPVQGHLMLFSGIEDSDSGKTGFKDTWFFLGPASLPGAPAESPSHSDLPVVTVDPSGQPEPVAPAVPGAAGQITAHDNAFWLGTKKIVLKGVNLGGGDGKLDEVKQLGAWGMNFMRLRIHWADLEPLPPVKVGGVWVHTYDPANLAEITAVIGWAAQYGLYVVIDNHPCSDDEACSYFGYPEWVYTAPYNSHGKTYAKTPGGILSAQTDFWSDDLRQQFLLDMWKYLVNQVKAMPGIIGYEIQNEPQIGNLPATHDTTQMVLDWELGVAKAIRARDPARVVVFTTRSGYGPGLPNANLSGWTSLGNVAFDLHDYFGARWGWGLNMNSDSPDFAETTGILYNNAVNGQSGPYIGSVYEHTRLLANRIAYLEGIPMFIGEAGDKDTDPGIYLYFATSLRGANAVGVSWAADYGGNEGFVDSEGRLLPWGSLVLQAI